MLQKDLVFAAVTARNRGHRQSISWVNTGVGKISCPTWGENHITLIPKAGISFYLGEGLSPVFCLKAMALKRKQRDVAVCCSPNSLGKVLALTFPVIPSG